MIAVSAVFSIYEHQVIVNVVNGNFDLLVPLLGVASFFKVLRALEIDRLMYPDDYVPEC